MTRIYTSERGIAIPASTASNVDTVRGWLKPIYTETGPDGRQLYGLGPADFNRVCMGYACPECLANFGDIYRAVCPACGYERDLASDVHAEPVHWKPDPNDPDRAA